MPSSQQSPPKNRSIGFNSTQFCIAEWQDAFDSLEGDIYLNAISHDTSIDDIRNINILLMWKPSITDWKAASRLQHVIYLGASVDMDTNPLQLPDGVTIHRLHDAGMKQAMCDYAEYAVLHYQRRFDHFSQAQQRHTWVNNRDYRQRHEIAVSILGLGILGSTIATHLHKVGYCVAGWSKSPKHIEGVNTVCGISSLHHCLNKCDVLINMLPHTQETHHFLNDERLSLLPKGAAIISLSRGAIIDTAALLKSLDNGHLRGAFLDVFEEEPLPKESPLWRHPQVTLTPHQSAPTQIIEAAKEITLLIHKIKRAP
jgi:glyoxylate/hydroxypyruvate reductase A